MRSRQWEIQTHPKEMPWPDNMIQPGIHCWKICLHIIILETTFVITHFFKLSSRFSFLAYLIYDKKSNSLVAIDPGPFAIARENIELVEYRKKAKLTHVFVTHHHKNHNGENFHLHNFRPDAQIIIGKHLLPALYNRNKN